jgi:putative glutamine amidotransferase
MPRPVIGLTCYLEPARWGAWDIEAALLPHWYIDLFQESGARVVILPPDIGADVDVLDRLDGLVIVGGADVNPASYGEVPHETSDQPRSSRDASESNLYRGARERRMPVLGICRGLQVMAIAHGGSLHQNLPDVSALVHRERPGQFVDHAATFTEGSMVAESLGATEVIVNSSHHQAVKDPGDLVVTGVAPDGTIEVCEDPSLPFCLGVQWHPEHPDRRVADLGLISRFLDAARAHSAGEQQ